MSNNHRCDICGKPMDILDAIHHHEPDIYRQLFVCKDCRDNGVRKTSKPATDVDIHKIIDDAMEKKDRSVTIFINSVGTSVYVNPYEDKPREWVDIADQGFSYLRWECPECGNRVQMATKYCPDCGEKLKIPV